MAELSNKQQTILKNRAKLKEQSPTEGNGQCCDNYLTFALKDNYHEFSLGITTVLECLLVAESTGDIPELPDEWKIQIINHYRLNVPSLKG